VKNALAYFAAASLMKKEALALMAMKPNNSLAKEHARYKHCGLICCCITHEERELF
jgi:hypothetical protein